MATSLRVKQRIFKNLLDLAADRLSDHPVFVLISHLAVDDILKSHTITGPLIMPCPRNIWQLGLCQIS